MDDAVGGDRPLVGEYAEYVQPEALIVKLSYCQYSGVALC
ncbi:hypothetical protein DGo_PB0077 (plasmid) [Deinococcus gobiensis I-0]|uniref:Uncharacterized protein n=1 Tax=Deinococcus gobiensis (strain DSM 21396 / JCM 16679 / CGMCC 1.7299 / I-0) TaxID=745776 RepID=H8H1E9_DEIGI|nr:hypothetical protein DGo_PB0077 [Deinococcus gobiensis I-0]